MRQKSLRSIANVNDNREMCGRDCRKQELRNVTNNGELRNVTNNRELGNVTNNRR